MTLEEIQIITGIIQNITLTLATVIAAWWAYATFGLKEKTDELLSIARKINEIHSHVDGSTLMYGYQKTWVELAGLDAQKLAEVKFGAEARLIALCEELSNLRDLSLRIAPAFRILTIGEHELALIDLRIQGIERWSDKELKEKIRASKVKILNEIYTEINKHSRFLNWLSIKISNGIYRIKHIGTTE